MELMFTHRNGKLSEKQRTYIEGKLSRLERYMDGIEQAKVEISHEQRLNKGEVQRLQVTLFGQHGIILRADQHGPDLYSTVDVVLDVLQRQIKRYKEKHWRRGRLRRKDNQVIDAETIESLPEEETIATNGFRRIVRVKEFAVKPMFSDEAIEQMELLGHSFFVFRDADTSNIAVVYRREDGNYGMIVSS
ncbi:MAG: ribosome-associated translation inhibitor RaiA [Chloroflexaceae bacterium]|nr:ribosome-associated translation inhibitor RaiA [Chloroflexaceae bacterium]